MVTRTEIDAAIERLKTLDARAAAAEAYAMAKQLVYRAPSESAAADHAQVWIMAIAMYFAAVSNDSGFAALQAILEERYRKMLAHASDHEIFTPLIDFPEPLDAYLRTLAMLPRELVLRSTESVRSLIAASS